MSKSMQLLVIIFLSVIMLQAGPRPGIARVVILGVDGMGSDNLWRDPYEGVPAPEVPTMESLMEAGAWTKNAKIDPLNFSGPNWNGMITGSESGDHGVTSNDCIQSSIETVYEVLRAQNSSAEIGAIFEWGPVGCYMGDGVLDHKVNTSNETATADAVIEYLTTTDVDFLFVHFDHVDGAGHSSGGHSQQYADKMEEVDHEMGRILTALEADGQLDSTLIIVTGDHGHHPTSGGHATDEFPVPFIVAGPGIIAGEVVGSQFGDLRNNQVAVVTTHALGLEPSAEWTNTLGLWSDAFGIPGCTDSLYVEYNLLATVDDGSCLTLVSSGLRHSVPKPDVTFFRQGRVIHFTQDILQGNLYGTRGRLVSLSRPGTPFRQFHLGNVGPGQYLLRFKTGSGWGQTPLYIH